jgi:hypothetical protein
MRKAVARMEPSAKSGITDCLAGGDFSVGGDELLREQPPRLLAEVTCAEMMLAVR